jgi:pSer/pThr/pTyr-binding forkhead associated (FHA) protein
MDKIHLRIGSSPDNDMVIESEGVDENHLELFCDSDGNVFITDLNTRNGTFINGEELNGYALLSQGDKVVLGRHYVFRWETFVRKKPLDAQIKNDQEPANDNNNKYGREIGQESKKTEQRTSNIELILIYGAIVIVLILMFILF